MSEVEQRLIDLLPRQYDFDYVEELLRTVILLLQEDNEHLNDKRLELLIRSELNRRFEAEQDALLVQDCLAKIANHIRIHINAAVFQTIEDKGSFLLPNGSKPVLSDQSINDFNIDLIRTDKEEGVDQIDAHVVVRGDLSERLNNVGIYSSDIRISIDVEESVDQIEILRPQDLFNHQLKVRIHPRQKIDGITLQGLVTELTENPDMLITQHILQYSTLYGR